MGGKGDNSDARVCHGFLVTLTNYFLGEIDVIQFLGCRASINYIQPRCLVLLGSFGFSLFFLCFSPNVTVKDGV